MKIGAVYVEEAVAGHPRTRQILERLPAGVRRIPVERYGEVFNRRAQNFRLQKRRPGLILARKHEGHVLPTPAGYGIGREANFYFSHLLNCPYDCRYCFLQGMYRSAHFVLFVNYEDFFDAAAGAAAAAARGSGGGPATFFSGYDADSLALEGLTGFAAAALEAFRDLGGAVGGHGDAAELELRTKSTRVRPLLDAEPYDHCVVAWSFTPREDVEHGVPALERRLRAVESVAKAGWNVGLRFDPVLACEGFEARYRGLFDRVFAAVPAERLHSVSLGPFRLPKPFFKRLESLWPDDPLVAGGPWETVDGMTSYRRDLEQRMVGFCLEELERRVPAEKLFPCELPG